jgi:YVTN family beta-propeller protein
MKALRNADLIFAMALVLSVPMRLDASEGLAAPRAGSEHGDASGGQDAPTLVYVANQGVATVTVIDSETLEIVDVVDLKALGFSANARPHHIVVEPDGSHWYVSMIGENRVLKFDQDNELVGQAEFLVPGMLALHPDGERLFVGRSMAAVNPPQRIGVIDRGDMSVDEIDVFYPRPHALAVHPSGDWVYSASLAANQMGAIDAQTDALELVTLEGDTHTLVQFAVSPDGNTLVATGQLTGLLLIFDISDPGAPALTGTVDVGAHPWHPVFTPDGRLVYFGNKVANTVTAVDMETREVVAVIEDEAIAQPHGSGVTPDGRRVFISSNNTGGGMDMSGGADGHEMPGYVVVIDTATQEVVGVVEVGANATGVGIRPAS